MNKKKRNLCRQLVFVCRLKKSVTDDCQLQTAR